MVKPDNRGHDRRPLAGGMDSLITSVEDQQRLKALSELGLLEPGTIPVFEEATQTAAHFLEAPICILGFIDQSRHWFKSAVGLSRIGLMNNLARERQLPRQESFCNQVIETHQVLAITDVVNHPNFANSVLTERYGIRAYLGAPLIDAAGNCLGSLAVMYLTPRSFTAQEIQFLELLARWSMSDFERNYLLQAQEIERQAVNVEALGKPLPAAMCKLPGIHAKQVVDRDSSQSTSEPVAINQVKLEILQQLSHDLRTPLTSILGMANVIGREIYGPLTSKQKEYISIIEHSGQYLLSLVNEITEIGALNFSTTELKPNSADVEMLCQLVINTLEEATNRREQEIRLSVEPGRRSRIWILDKEKVRSMLYHLLLSVIQASPHRSIVRIHVSHKSTSRLSFTISVSHPWLGDGLLEVDYQGYQLPTSIVSSDIEASSSLQKISSRLRIALETITEPEQLIVNNESFDSSHQLISSDASVQEQSDHKRADLHLLLSCYLAQLQGGHILLQGTLESGYRYVVSLPELQAEN